MIRQWLKRRDEQKKIGNVAMWIKHHVETRLHDSDFKFGSGDRNPPNFWFYDRDDNQHVVYKICTVGPLDQWFYVYNQRGICQLNKAEVKMLRIVHDKVAEIDNAQHQQHQQHLRQKREAAMVDALSKLM